MKLGYVGLGALGGELAQRFLGGESPLHVWDLNADALARFAALGAKPVHDAAELAQQCDAVLICLPRSSDVKQMIFGTRGLAEGLRAGTLVIDQTSGMPEDTRDMAQQLAGRDVVMLDAAVSANPSIVSQGLATLMVGGADAVFARALPILRCITPTIYRCGTRVGDGQAMKIVNNAMNGTARIATLELVALGRSLGLPLRGLMQVLNQSQSLAQNQTTDKMLPAIAAGRASTNFSLSLMLKDMDQAVALGMLAGAPMPLVSVARGLMQIGLNTLGASARLEDMVGVVESMAATCIADHSEGEPEIADVDSAQNTQATIVRDAIAATCLAIALECVSAGYKYGLSLSAMAAVLDRSSGWSTASRLLLDGLTKQPKGQAQPLAGCAPAQLTQTMALAATLAVQAGAPVLCMHAARSQFESALNGANDNEPDGQALLRHYETSARVTLQSRG